MDLLIARTFSQGEIKEKEGISNDGISRIDVSVRTFWKIGKVN